MAIPEHILQNAKESIRLPKYRIMRSRVKDYFLKNQGYVVLPMLTAEEVQVFQTLYDKWHTETPERFYKSYFSTDAAYREEVEAEVLRVFVPKLKEHFHDFKAFGGMFVIKPKGDPGHIPAHQDWSFVDEKQHWSINLWCPLIDTTGDNGNMQMLPGSHLFMETLRGFGTPEVYAHLKDDITPHLVDVPLKAGECVFFYHGIVHCSPENFKETPRVSLGLSMVQKDAAMRYAYLKEGNEKADLYNVNPEFYINYTANRDQMPKGVTYRGTSPIPFASFTPEELEDKVEEFDKFRWLKDALGIVGL